MEIWEPKPPGTLGATPGLLRDPFTFSLIDINGCFPGRIISNEIQNDY